MWRSKTTSKVMETYLAETWTHENRKKLCCLKVNNKSVSNVMANWLKPCYVTINEYAKDVVLSENKLHLENLKIVCHDPTHS